MVPFKRIPIVATDFSWHDFISIFKVKAARQRSANDLSRYLNSKYVFSVNSGTSAFYLILKALSYLNPDRKEVILPAYTAASLILPIRELGLKTVLCDISLTNFDLDLDKLSNIVTDKTLCVVAIHSFGLACDVEGIKKIVKQKSADVFIVEDCAQAFGTLIANWPVGAQGDISLYSFNRGKNISTAWGGAISTNRDDLAGILEDEIKQIKEQFLFNKWGIIFELIFLSFIIRPFIYNCLYPLLKTFRSARPPLDFQVKAYTDIQAAIFSSLLKRIELFSQKRYANGCFIYDFLKERKDVTLPQLLNFSRPAYNRFPIIFKDLAHKERIKNKLFKLGVDSSEMYERPLHLIFELDYKQGDFPNAEYFATHLLTLPSHPLVGEETLKSIKKIFKMSL